VWELAYVQVLQRERLFPRHSSNSVSHAFNPRTHGLNTKARKGNQMTTTVSWRHSPFARMLHCVVASPHAFD
jgi:hypothetical protein